MRDERLDSILAKRNEIGRINMQIVELARQRGEIEREFLAEVAVMIGRPGATLLDSHHRCPTSPIGHCLFEITAETDDSACLFCRKPINR